MADETETQFWLVSLPLDAGGRGSHASRTKDTADHVLATLNDKAGDMATTHKARGHTAVAGRLAGALTV